MTTRTRDHEITIGSTTRSLTLLRDTSGKAMYSESEDVPEHLDKILFAQKNWLGGHGQYEVNNPNMYFDGQSIDTTQEGRILLGPEINQVYVAAVTTLKDSFEDVDAGYTSNMPNCIAQTFTAGSSYTLASLGLKMYRPSEAYHPGTITVEVRTTAAGDPTSTVLCSGTIDGNTLATTSTWYVINMSTTTPIVSGTVYAIVPYYTASGTQMIIGGEQHGGYAGGNLHITYDAQVTWTNLAYDIAFRTYGTSSTEMTDSPTCFFWSTTAAKWLCASSDKTYYYNGATWLPATTVLAGVLGFSEFNGVIFAALGTGTAYYYSTDGDTWTVSTLTDHHATGFLSAPSANGLTNVLWKTLTPNQISSNTSGTDAGAVQWTTPNYIGDTTNNITNIFLSGDKLMVGRADNLYVFDADGTVHELMPDLKVCRTTQNFKYVAHWQGNTYFSAGTGLYELTSYNTLNKMGPLQDTGDLDKVGTVVGLAADIDYLYVAMVEGTVTHIYKGKTIEGVWSWCPIIYLGTNACSTIAIAQHSVTDKRLWFGYGTHTGYCYISDNPTADSNARYASSGWLRTSWIYGSNPYFDKLIQSVVLELACTVVESVGGILYVPANVTVQPKYRIADAPMTNLTAAINHPLYGVTKTNLTAALVGNKIQIELDLSTTDSTMTPVVRSIQITGSEKPTTYKIHEATYNIYSDPDTKASTLITFLEGGRTSTSLIKFARLNFGESTVSGYKYVIMEPGYPKVISVYDEKNMQGDFAIQCRFREVNYTVPTSPATYTVSYTLSGDTAGTGIEQDAVDVEAPASTTVTAGQSITIEAVGDMAFIEWTINGATVEDNPYTLTINENTTIDAEFLEPM